MEVFNSNGFKRHAMKKFILATKRPKRPRNQDLRGCEQKLLWLVLLVPYHPLIKVLVGLTGTQFPQHKPVQESRCFLSNHLQIKFSQCSMLADDLLETIPKMTALAIPMESTCFTFCFLIHKNTFAVSKYTKPAADLALQSRQKSNMKADSPAKSTELVSRLAEKDLSNRKIP